MLGVFYNIAKFCSSIWVRCIGTILVAVSIALVSHIEGVLNA